MSIATNKRRAKSIANRSRTTVHERVAYIGDGADRARVGCSQ